MSKKGLAKITSKYIIQKILDFIKDDKFAYKLFFYSKSFQQKINIDLYDYQILYLIKKNIKLEKYLAFDEEIIYNNYLDKNAIKRNLDSNLFNENIDIDINKGLIIKYFKKYFKSLKNKNNDEKESYRFPELFIDIFSPFFEYLSKDKIIENFGINILIKDIDKNNLVYDYISTFNNLNQLKAQYISLRFNFINDNHLLYINTFNIKSEKIKRLTIINEYYDFNYFNDNYFPI